MSTSIGFMPGGTARRDLRPLTSVTEACSSSRAAFTFAVTGDSRPTVPGCGFPQVTHRLFEELRLVRPAFVLYTGDFMWGYNGSRQEMLNDIARFTALADTLGVPLYNVPGNHEMQSDPESVRMLRQQGHDLYGSFDVGRWHFIGLNTDEFFLEGRVSGAQLEWLRADLEAHQDADGIFVFMHRPMHSWFQGDFNPDDRAVLRELFAAHGVRAVFAAHDHFFHDEEHEGVRYMTVAGAGSPAYASPAKGGYAHYVLVSVAPDGVDYGVIVPGRLDVEYVAGNDGIEPTTAARVSNGTDRDIRLRRLELRVPRLASEEDYDIAGEFVDWKRDRHEVPVSLQEVEDREDGSAVLAVCVDVPTGVAVRVSAEARYRRRTLIVNADDLGRSAAINAGIFRAHVEGVVTSASLMVRWPDAEDAARAAAGHPGLGLGLHLDLGEWAYRAGEWLSTYEVVDLDDAEAVAREVRAQLDRFRALVGAEPDHLDSHQHVHMSSPVVRDITASVARELGVPLRSHSDRVSHCGDFYGRTAQGELMHDGIGSENLLRIVSELPEGVTEVGCHPGAAGVDDPLYGDERALELQTLCDPAVRDALDRRGVRLTSFARLRTVA